MTDVHWIKLSTDLYHNRKIRYLRRLPKGDSLALIWVMLLTLAGRCNAGGVVFFTESVPYTVKMLAEELNVKESTLLTALNAFEFAEMISRTEDGFIFILGWEEHQNTEKLEKVKEQSRVRKLRYLEKQKALKAGNAKGTQRNASENVPENVPGTQRNGTDIDTDTEKETEIKEEREENALCENANVKKTKQFVPPTVEEVREYCLSRKSGVDPVRFWEYFDTGGWKDSEGKPVRNWKQKLFTWETHSKEKGGAVNDTGRNSSDGLSEWNIHYTFDGRTL